MLVEIIFDFSQAQEKKQRQNPKLDAGGKPSTWFPPGTLVEHINNKKRPTTTTTKPTAAA